MFRNKTYIILSIILLVASIFGGVYLVKQNQDTREKAVEPPAVCEDGSNGSLSWQCTRCKEHKMTRGCTRADGSTYIIDSAPEFTATECNHLCKGSGTCPWYTNESYCHRNDIPGRILCFYNNNDCIESGDCCCTCGGENPTGSDGGSGDNCTPPPCDSSKVNMTVSPGSITQGQNITFSVSGDQGSTNFGDTFTGGVTCPGFPIDGWPKTQTCTTNASNTFTWTHTWRNCACDTKPEHCSPTVCSKPLDFTISPSTPPPTATPTRSYTFDPPVDVPNCKNLTGPKNITLGNTYDYTFTAEGTVTTTSLASYRSNCSDWTSSKDSWGEGKAGLNHFKFTPTQTGTYTLFGRVWNDGIAECRASCVDKEPRYPCVGPSCTLVVNVAPRPTATPTESFTFIPDGSTPNCKNLTGPTEIIIGSSAAYTFTAEGTVTGVSLDFFKGTTCDKTTGRNLGIYHDATSGVQSFVWTPPSTGTYTLFGRVWNDNIAECRASCVDIPPRYPCDGPSCTLTVNVVPRPTNTPIRTSTSTPTPIRTSTNTPTPRNVEPTAAPDDPTSTPIPPTGTPIIVQITQPGGSSPTIIYVYPATSTPVPPRATSTTNYIAQGPTPTPIVLPQAGVEFPFTTLTILGVIISLVGFLVLL